MRIAFYLSCFLSWAFAAHAQFTKDKAVPIHITVQTAPPSVHLEWLTPTAIHDVVLWRREKEDHNWQTLLQTTLSIVHTYTDTTVELGKTYEYRLRRAHNGNIVAYGYATVPVEAPAEHQRGLVSVFVEAALEAPLTAEFERLRRDMAGDGWSVHWHSVQPDDDIYDIKAQLIADHDSTQLHTALLFGDIPVPYSGLFAWDGHPDHGGAWPADTWYADLDTVWSDSTVDFTGSSRPQNINVPGDGKFDPYFLPSPLEVAIGRVDFSNLSEATFGTPLVELYRRYLDKNHRWRNGQYQVQQRVLIDDNFGYFNGEAFAANGWRNGYPLVGVENVLDGDFFTSTDTSSYLMAYGCGAGSYTSAAGVGTSTQFATDSLPVVFTMLFGSYHGDWDYSPNPFMPSALASKGGILSCSWAGRPHWFYHPLAAGKTLGFCTLVTQNSCFDSGYFSSVGSCGTHVSLLGDPTLRAQVVQPPAKLEATTVCNDIVLTWEAPSQADVLGYHVYRSQNADGPYELLNDEPVPSAPFTDNDPPSGTVYYQVRALVLEQTPSGRFFNTSTGIITEIEFSPVVPPTANPIATAITCRDTVAMLMAHPTAPGYKVSWEGPEGFFSSDENTITDLPGLYTLTLIDPATGCASTYEVAVEVDTVPPPLQVSDVALTCAQASISFDCPLFFDCKLIGPNGDVLPLPALIDEGGIYTLQVTHPLNGCSTIDAFEVSVDTLPADVLILGDTVLLCSTGVLQAVSSDSSAFFWWEGPGIVSPVDAVQIISEPGVYSVTATDAKGCVSVASVEVKRPFPPLLIADVFQQVDCEGYITDVTPAITGGQPPYMVVLAPLPPIAPGATFEVVVTDAVGCVVSHLQQNDHQPSDLQVFAGSTAESSPGAADGTAWVSAEAGEPPYQVSWSTGATTDTITGLSAGSYSFTVTDNMGCTATGTVTVEIASATLSSFGLGAMRVFPNPTSRFFTVEVELPSNTLAVSPVLRDVLGRERRRFPTKKGTLLRWQVDGADLPAGLYFLLIESSAGTMAVPIVVE